MQIRAQRIGSEQIFPEPWRELMRQRCSMLADTLQDVDEVVVRIDVVQAAGGKKALDDRRGTFEHFNLSVKAARKPAQQSSAVGNYLRLESGR